jgi:hypothetical protein
MSSNSEYEDLVVATARDLARAAGLNPDGIAEQGEPEPIEEDRGDGVTITVMRRPLRPNWSVFVQDARRKLGDGPAAASNTNGAGRSDVSE